MEEKTSRKERRVSKKNEGEERRLEEERKGKSGAIQARVAKKKKKEKSHPCAGWLSCQEEFRRAFQR